MMMLFSIFNSERSTCREMANTLWPLQPYRIRSKTAVILDDKRYFCPYETLLFSVLQGLDVVERKWRASSENRSKISSEIKAMVDAMHS
jgi:hypothetical protein